MSDQADIQIRVLLPTEWKAYRKIRLRALKDSPKAFGSTFQESVLRADQEWQDRLANASPQLDLPLVAQLGEHLVGLAWGQIDTAGDEVAHLYQMWVAPEVRGRGLGRRLMEKAIAWAKAKRTRRMLLDVTVGNLPAEQLYLSLGFRPQGNAAPVRPGSKLLEQSMVLKF